MDIQIEGPQNKQSLHTRRIKRSE